MDTWRRLGAHLPEEQDVESSSLSVSMGLQHSLVVQRAFNSEVARSNRVRPECRSAVTRYPPRLECRSAVVWYLPRPENECASKDLSEFKSPLLRVYNLFTLVNKMLRTRGLTR